MSFLKATLPRFIIILLTFNLMHRLYLIVPKVLPLSPSLKKDNLDGVIYVY